MDSSNTVKLPGFGLPLDHMPRWRRNGESQRFPHAIADLFVSEGATLREKRMLDFINQVTDKPRWQEKVYDEEIVDRWRTEACGSDNDQETSPNHLSLKCFDYCMQELKDKAAYHQKHGVVHVLDVEATIVKADVDDNGSVCPLLIEAVRPLEAIPDSRKDWHPGSDGLVLDLVHPSLFPLQYGKSLVLPNGRVGLSNCAEYICQGVQCAALGELTNNLAFRRLGSDFQNSTLQPWGSYQWLPSDIRFRQDGTASIESYINNLHPQQHPGLYSVLEKAVDAVVPLWNEALSFFHTRIRIPVGSCGFDDFKAPTFPASGTGDEQVEDREGADDDDGDDPDGEYESSDISEEERIHRWLRDNPDQRQLIQPEPLEDFIPFEERVEKERLRRLDIRTVFPDGLQVIFKLANIQLTPDNPHYGGSDWHVEGALNEHICATALIYYGQENIGESYLEFRQQIDVEEMTMKPCQDEHMAAEDMYGIEQQGRATQDLGKVLTRKGRMLAFPNVMQHRICPFGLDDTSKPGYRKILAMFLVDPHIRVLSTANVPPQRRDWWADEVRPIEPFSELPVEIFDRIIEHVDTFPISWDEACENREALMAERGRARESFDQALAEDTFFFCEH